MSNVGAVIFTLRDVPDLPPAIVLTMANGREVLMEPHGHLTRHEARVILGAMMNVIRAGLRADQFRHGTILKENPRV